MINRLGLVLFWLIIGVPYLAILIALVPLLILSVPFSFIVTGNGDKGIVLLDWWMFNLPKIIAYWFGVNFY